MIIGRQQTSTAQMEISYGPGVSGRKVEAETALRRPALPPNVSIFVGGGGGDLPTTATHMSNTSFEATALRWRCFLDYILTQTCRRRSENILLCFAAAGTRYRAGSSPPRLCSLSSTASHRDRPRLEATLAYIGQQWPCRVLRVIYCGVGKSFPSVL